LRQRKSGALHHGISQIKVRDYLSWSIADNRLHLCCRRYSGSGTRTTFGSADPGGVEAKASRAIGNAGASKSEDVKERRVIDALRNRPARSLTLTERTEIAEIAKTKPSIDLEINFDYNSDVVRLARQPLQTLGRALSNEQMKGTVFFVNSHTDAVGGVDFNQDLSERRAEAVKRILIQEFRLPAATLIAVGYGKTQLKNTTNSFAAENRRVQIVNTEQRTTARDKAPE
jgi:outer membrane protein OmpA-like peptidoglycan-associated protein